MSAPSPRTLESRLGYTFTDQGLLDRALTHRSAARRNNERLEFLGDAVLGMAAAELLYERHPDYREGPLTRARALLVRRESLAVIARGLELGRYLHLGAGELKSGGRERDSILADALEAIVGAVHLDGGMDASRSLVRRLLAERVEAIDSASPPVKDAKTRLQEYLQGRGLALPAYEVADISGSSHQQTFTVTCAVATLDITVEGAGGSRRQAEQAAAARVLAVIDGR